MTDNAFAAAAQQASTPAPSRDPLTGNQEGYDPLFGGKSLPSLFVKTHAPGASKTGIVSDVPFRKQSRFYTRDGSIGALKFWGDDNKPTEQSTDAAGKARRPVEDEVWPLTTEYRDRSKDGQPDSGDRAFYAGNKYAMDALIKAVRAAGISSREQIKGMRLTIVRKGEEGKWEYEATLSR